MKLIIDIGDLNERMAEKAVNELRRLNASYDNASKLRVASGQMSASDCALAMLPLQTALAICSSVSMALSDPEPIPASPADRACPASPASPASPAAPADSAICCLCEGIGIYIERVDAYRCSNKRCPRYGVPLPRQTFIGFEEEVPVQPSAFSLQPSPETRQDRAGALPAANVHSPV